MYQDVLVNPSAEDKIYLKDLLSSRIDQGRGETLFEIGIEGKKINNKKHYVSNVLVQRTGTI
jgi:hypothetical protein